MQLRAEPRRLLALAVAVVTVAVAGSACSPAASVVEPERPAPGQPRALRSEIDSARAADRNGVGEQAAVTTPTESSGEPQGSTTTVAPQPGPVGPVRTVRVSNGETWVDTTCAMTPADSYWHARVDRLPTLQPVTPDGSGLSGFPGGESTDDPLRMRSGLRNENGKTITWTDATDPMRWVRIGSGWQGESEYSAVETAQMGPFAVSTAGLLRHRVPETVLIELTSTDDHALFVDTDACSLIEYIRWNRIPGVFSGHKATVNDLRTNERRLSVRPGWLDAPTNNAGTGLIDSPRGTIDAPLHDFDERLLERPRKGLGASGGSAIPSSPGLVRVEEVFATPVPGDQTVAPSARIDHVIAAALPWENVTGMPGVLTDDASAPFTWPATVTDGCGGGNLCLDGDTGSAYHVPMGSRLRLSSDRCDDPWNEPQARVIVEALCNYGVVITDTTDAFHICTERGPGGATSKWRREAERELATLTLRDFELVDMSSVAAVDTAALWQEAVDWGLERYGHGSTPPGGWYEGTFWNAVLGCDRVGGKCSDPALARVDAAVNSPQWYGMR